MEKLNLSIKKPCSENFSTFSKTSNGGFCQSCKKNVVDFTKMSDHELLTYFDRRKNKTCGQFLESQLKTYEIPNSSKFSKATSLLSSHFFNISVLSLLSFNSAFSQEPKTAEALVKVDSQHQATVQDTTKINKEIIVEGIIRDNIGPLPGANIHLKNTTIGVQSDVDGRFKFPIPLKVNDVLVVGFIGFHDKEVIIKDEKNDIRLEIDVKLKQQDIILLGEVSTNKVYTSKKTFFQKLKSFFSND